MSSRIIMGFDPGLADTGYGIIKEEGNKLTCLAYGSIITKAKTSLSERLEIIYQETSKLLKKHKPELVAVEQLFFSRNVSTALIVGHARGVVLLAIEQANLPMIEFTPNQVKQAVSAYGSAGKTQVQRMVKTLLGLKEIPKPDDAADALAIAICGLNSREYLKKK